MINYHNANGWDNIINFVNNRTITQNLKCIRECKKHQRMKNSIGAFSIVDVAGPGWMRTNIGSYPIKLAGCVLLHVYFPGELKSAVFYRCA